MTAKLPPLAWFRAFDAAARHLSVTAAARELGLTQPAVSQQIRLLEHRFNMVLFERRPRGLALTDAGRRLLPQVSDSIDGLARLISEFDTQQEKSRLNIAASASFARTHIAPILPEFLYENPSCNVKIRTTLWHDDFQNSDADVEIRFGSARLAGRGATELCGDRVVAVCAPSCFSEPPTWSDICATQRIQTVAISETWGRWAAALKWPEPNGDVVLVDSHSLAIDLARSGTGVALTSLLLAAPHLLSGALVMPIAASVAASERYFLWVKHQAGHARAVSLADHIHARADAVMRTCAEQFLAADTKTLST